MSMQNLVSDTSDRALHRQIQGLVRTWTIFKGCVCVQKSVTVKLTKFQYAFSFCYSHVPKTVFVEEYALFFFFNHH